MYGVISEARPARCTLRYIHRMDEHADWPEVRDYRRLEERQREPGRQTEPQEACFWAGCATPAVPVSHVDGLWLRLCYVHCRAVHHALDEGLRIERRWKGDVHPIVWLAPARPPT